MNLDFMELVRKEHPYWDNLKFPSEDEMREVFNQAISSPNDIKIFIIEHDNIIMGYANTWDVYSVWTMGKSLIIDDLYICKEFRNKGYGKRVMNYLIDYAKSNVFKRIQLSAEKDNIIAQTLYKKLGFDDEDMVFFMKRI
ncbi:MAG: ribosomal protein S18 acetylase RimI-like enzyme [Clostridium sp.]|jgi:ribosomal protein S18 acetylase RimI-like enzyme